MKELKKQIEKCLSNIVADGGGGCSIEKAFIMAEYIMFENIKYSVEIGVYNGRSFFPQALAHKITGGKIIGIDPYLKEAAREKDLPKDIAIAVDKLIDNWNTIEMYISNLERILSLQLGNNAFIIRDTSENIVSYLPDNIELLHIDGNHDISFVTKDISLYVPKLKPGGIIVMDDTDWDSVKSCLYLLSENQCILERDFNTWQVWRK